MPPHLLTFANGILTLEVGDGLHGTWRVADTWDVAFYSWATIESVLETWVEDEMGRENFRQAMRDWMQKQ